MRLTNQQVGRGREHRQLLRSRWLCSPSKQYVLEPGQPDEIPELSGLEAMSSS